MVRVSVVRGARLLPHEEPQGAELLGLGEQQRHCGVVLHYAVTQGRLVHATHPITGLRRRGVLRVPENVTVSPKVSHFGESDWSGGHVLHLALPTVEWPRGRPVLTSTPTRYRGTGIRTIRIVERG
jgi:hypothetical protein